MASWLVWIAGIVLVVAGSAALGRRLVWLVAEDNVAITVDRNGFVKRVLPAGRHLLGLAEKVEFMVETKTRLAAHQATAVVTGEGVPVNIGWSGTYSLQPGLINDRKSQRLRSLPQAERAIFRNADICLRKLVGAYGLEDLFKPAIRERLERQLNQLLAERLKPMGIVFNGLNLSALELPGEVTEALNKARAIKTLDEAIRQIDPATRDIVAGVYQLDEVLHWETYLPVPSRLMKKQAGISRPVGISAD